MTPLGSSAEGPTRTCPLPAEFESSTGKDGIGLKLCAIHMVYQKKFRLRRTIFFVFTLVIILPLYNTLFSICQQLFLPTVHFLLLFSYSVASFHRFKKICKKNLPGAALIFYSYFLVLPFESVGRQLCTPLILVKYIIYETLQNI